MTQITKFKDQIRGDVFEEKTIELYYEDTDIPIFLNECSIIMSFRIGSKTGKLIKQMSLGSGLTMIDEELGTFKIDRTTSFLPYSDIYYYDLQVTFPRGEVKTYLQGTILVTQDVSF